MQIITSGTCQIPVLLLSRAPYRYIVDAKTVFMKPSTAIAIRYGHLEHVDTIEAIGSIVVAIFTAMQSFRAVLILIFILWAYYIIY